MRKRTQQNQDLNPHGLALSVCHNNRVEGLAFWSFDPQQCGEEEHLSLIALIGFSDPIGPCCLKL